MSAVTLALVQAKQAELAAMIQQLQQQPAPTRLLRIPAVEIELRAGERYAGAVLDHEGFVTHYVILMPQRPNQRLAWPGAMAWAQSVGGDLPSRQEQSLLFANCQPHIEADWYWSREVHEDDGDHAWCCGFTSGQGYYRQYDKGAAVAVRRLNP